MEAVIECVRNTVGEGVRRIRTPNTSKKKVNMTSREESKSKIFGIDLEDVCMIDQASIPFIIVDLCSLIIDKHLKSQGIFRVSAPQSQTSRLKKAYEDYYKKKEDEKCAPEGAPDQSNSNSVAEMLNIDGNTIACLIKYFFRQLPQPLVPNSILQLTVQSTCLSDESFASSVRQQMSSLPSCYFSTLQYLLSFLRHVLREPNNRMNVKALAIVFAPNTFTSDPRSLLSGSSPLDHQALANRAFERLLLASDVICKDFSDDQGYLTMTSQPNIERSIASCSSSEDEESKSLDENDDVDRAIREAVHQVVFQRLFSDDDDVSRSDDVIDDEILDDMFESSQQQDADLCDVTQIFVPPLDLSDVITQHDKEVVTSSSLPIAKPRIESSQLNQGDTAKTLMKSNPIEIPNSKTSSSEDQIFQGFSLSPSPRWRDAWSTEDKVTIAERFPGSSSADDDMDLAPSSPSADYFEGYKRHHHLRHHRHQHDGSRKHRNHLQEDVFNLRIQLERITSALDKSRKQDGRPEDVTLMTRQQILAEKVAMQRELLRFETDHGRPSSKWQRDVMRVIYDRYRTVKRLLLDTMSPTLTSQHRRVLKSISRDPIDLTRVVDDDQALRMTSSGESVTKWNNDVTTEDAIKDQISGDLEVEELKKQLEEVKHQKKMLRRRIRDFEREFKLLHHRSPTHADMVVMATEYSEYREARSRLRLLEALIEKQI